MKLTLPGRAAIVSITALVAVWLVFTWPLLTPFTDQRMHITEGDFTNQFYPFRYFTADQIHRFRPPLWNPYMFGGHPFQADPQTAVFYPPALLIAALLGAGGLPIEALELETAAHYLLALIFSYGFFVAVTGRHLPAVGGAICFGLSGYLTSYPAQQLAILETAVWLPAVLVCVELGIRRGATILWAGIAAVPVTLALLAGHSQTLLFVAYLAGAYAIWRLFQTKTGFTRSGLFLISWGAMTVGLAAVQLAPTIEFIGISDRQNLGYSETAQGYLVASLIGILAPSWLEEKALYLGAPAIFAIASSAFSRRPPWFWLSAFVIALLVSLGGHGPLYPLLHGIAPGFSLFRHQERAMIVAAFAAATMTAHWLALMGHGYGTLRRKLAGPALVVLASIALWALIPILAPEVSAAHRLSSRIDTVIVGLAILMIAAILVAQHRWTVSLTGVGVLLIAILLVDLVRINYHNNLTPARTNVIVEFAPVAQYLAEFPEPYRVASETDAFFPPNYGALLHMPMLAGDSPIKLKRPSVARGDHRVSWKYWQLMNVKFHLSPGLELEGTEQVFNSENVSLRRIIDTLPLVWAVRDYRIAESEANALELIGATDFHPGDYVILEERPDGLGAIQPGPRPHTEIVSLGPLRKVIKTRSDAPGLLVIAESYHPGWQAWIDGQQSPVYRANYAAQALFLPEGEHVINLVYAPLSLVGGAGVTMLTALFLGLLGWRAWASRRRSLDSLRH